MPAKPTPKQAKAMELIREGKTPTQAMRDAGYSEQTASAPTRNLLSSPGAQAIIESMKEEYAAVGITRKYIAAKMAQWLEAKKLVSARIILKQQAPGSTDADLKDAYSRTDDFIEVDDYQTQLKAAEMIRKDWGLGQEEKGATFTADTINIMWNNGAKP